MSNLLANYSAFLDQRYSSANTISAYIRDIKTFSEYLDTEDDLLSVDSKVLSKYMEYMLECGKTTASVTRFLMAARSFYGYLAEKNVIDENPAKDVQPLKVEREPPVILSRQEVDRLLAQPAQKHKFDMRCFAYRDAAMLELLYATGIRVGELVALNVEDANIEASCVRCGPKNRIIPIYIKAKNALDDYIQHGRSELALPSEKALFVNRDGTRMSRQGFWKLLKNYVADAGIHKEVSPKTLRHSFGMHLLENGADLETIQNLMGHSCISSTMLYEGCAQTKLRDAYFNFHPRNVITNDKPKPVRKNWRETVKNANR